MSLGALMKDIVYKTELFLNISRVGFEDIFNQINFDESIYEKGEIIDNLSKNNRSIGIVINGKIKAMKYLISGEAIFLKLIKAGEIFGVSNVFQDSNVRLSYLEVEEKSKILYINEAELSELLKNEKVMKNYINLLNTKIQYLNQKIDIVSQSTIKDKVLMFFLNQQSIQNNKKFITINMKKNSLADYIGISRSSLYRVLKSLEKDNYIKIEDDRVLFKKNYKI